MQLTRFKCYNWKTQLRKSPSYKAKTQRQWNYEGKLRAKEEWLERSNIQLIWTLERENGMNTKKDLSMKQRISRAEGQEFLRLKQKDLHLDILSLMKRL